jgi:D-serine deaminase-like pyridoxal phosphate-dependent protein
VTSDITVDALTAAAGSPELADIATPFLVVDLDAMERNVERMAAFFRGRRANLRPHVKHHKCSEIARLQMNAGAAGLTCATTDEVRAMADAGIGDLLLANVVTDRRRLRSLASDARRATVTVAADSVKSVQMLSEAARSEQAEVGVVVDFDIGLHRNGVATVEEALQLADLVRAMPALTFEGVMAYEGHLVAVEDREARATAVAAAFEPVATLVRELEANGFDVTMVTGGAASTYESVGQLPFMTDVQAGSYVLMDASYARLVPEFEIALAVVATVTTARAGRPVVVDAGSKRLATDWGTPVLHGFESEHVATSEEHNRFWVHEPRLPAVGERVAVVPGHSCPTVSMHRRLFGCREGRLERLLDIDARDPLA